MVCLYPINKKSKICSILVLIFCIIYGMFKLEGKMIAVSPLKIFEHKAYVKYKKRLFRCERLFVRICLSV